MSEQILKQLVVKDDFIPPSACKAIVAGYHKSNSNMLNIESDNKVDIDDRLKAADIYAYEACISTVMNVRDFLVKTYAIEPLYLDYAALFSRIIGNRCSYHCDNALLDCPIHGNDQEYLRSVRCECVTAKFKPNHTPWRNYTALLYLDSNHKGGEIIFQDGPVSKTYTKKIMALEGRLVTNPITRDYYHETTPVTEGIRYSMNMWFTSDPNNKWDLI